MDMWIPTRGCWVLWSAGVCWNCIWCAQCRAQVTSGAWKTSRSPCNHSCCFASTHQGLSYWNSLFTLQLTEGPLEEAAVSVAANGTNSEQEIGHQHEQCSDWVGRILCNILLTRGKPSVESVGILDLMHNVIDARVSPNTINKWKRH